MHAVIKSEKKREITILVNIRLILELQLFMEYIKKIH